MRQCSADINDMPVAVDYLDPERIGEPDRADAQDEWLQEWIDGNLVEASGDDYYHGPIQRVLEADGIADIAAAIEAMRDGRWPQVTALAAKLLTDIESEIRKDAPQE